MQNLKILQDTAGNVQEMDIFLAAVQDVCTLFFFCSRILRKYFLSSSVSSRLERYIESSTTFSERADQLHDYKLSELSQSQYGEIHEQLFLSPQNKGPGIKIS